MSRWDQEYRSLSAGTRAAVNDLVNWIFQQETGFQGKINPHTQPELARKWMTIRDNVLANRQRFAQWLNQAGEALQDFAAAIPIFKSLDTRPAWIRAAQGEIGVKETNGAANNPRVMEYIRTCTAQYDAKKRQAWENMGDSGVEWCACFVNWCLLQAGITGLNTAWAPSWFGWGRRIYGPERGAIVCFKWSWLNSPYTVDHIAFCDVVNGEFRTLGGNQGTTGIVSSVPFNRRDAVYYCLPPGH